MGAGIILTRLGHDWGGGALLQLRLLQNVGVQRAQQVLRRGLWGKLLQLAQQRRMLRIGYARQQPLLGTYRAHWQAFACSAGHTQLNNSHLLALPPEFLKALKMAGDATYSGTKTKEAPHSA